MWAGSQGPVHQLPWVRGRSGWGRFGRCPTRSNRTCYDTAVPFQPDTVRRRSWTVWVSAGVSWLIGFGSIFLIAPTSSGRGVIDSYALFQAGSILGNVLALVFWSCTALPASWLLARASGPTWIHAFLAYGVPAVILLFPAAVVSNAVAHGVPVDDVFVYRDWLAGPLVISGLVAMSIALVSSLLSRNRKARP